MDARGWLVTYQERLRELGERVATAERALAGLEASAASGDGAVTVTVDHAGALRRVEFSERSRDLSRTQLGDAVVAAAGQARAEAARLAAEAVGSPAGAGGARPAAGTGRAPRAESAVSTRRAPRLDTPVPSRGAP